MTWRAGLPVSLGPGGYAPQTLRMLAESRWTPQARSPAIMVDAHSGVTAKVPVANCTVAANDSFSRASNSTLQLNGGDYTIAIFAYMTAKTANNWLVTKMSSGVNYEYGLHYRSDGSLDRFAFFIGDNAGTSQLIEASTAGSPSTGVWYAVVVRHVLSTKTVTITVVKPDGVLYSDSEVYSLTAADAGGIFRIGSFLGTNGADAQMASVAVAKRAWSDAEVLAYWNGQVPPLYSDAVVSTTDMQSWWNLNEPSAGTAAVTRNDAHGTNHLTDNNTVPSVQGPRDAIAIGASGQVSQTDDPRGASVFSGVQATASRQPKWVPNSGQPYLEALSTTSKLSDTSTGVTIDYNTPRTIGGLFYYPASATADGVMLGTGEGVNNFHTTSIGALSNTVLQFTAATTSSGSNGILVRKTVSNLQGTYFTWFATFPGSGGAAAVKLYLNKVLQTSPTVVWDTLSSGSAPDSSVQLIGIGGGNALAGMRHAASILDTKVWTEADIARFHRWAKRRWPSFNLP